MNIDTVAPTIAAQRDTAANGYGWNNTDVASSYVASDVLAGLDDNSPAAGAYTFTTDGEGQSHTFTVTDKAGNTATATVSDVNIDTVAPTIAAQARHGGQRLRLEQHRRGIELRGQRCPRGAGR